MEHSILLIKPDGVELGIEKQCEKIIAKYNLDIVKKKYLKVSREDIVNNFYYRFKNYIDYMTSGQICAIFLRGKDANMDEVMYIIKNHIRQLYSVSGKDMKNLVHATHCGTEFFLQRNLLFPEYISYKYTGGADLLVYYEDIKKNKMGFKKVLLESYIDTLGIITKNENDLCNIRKIAYMNIGIKIVIGIEKSFKTKNYEGTLICYTDAMKYDCGNQVIAVNEINQLNDEIVDEINACDIQTFVIENEGKRKMKIKNLVQELIQDGHNVQALVINTSNMSIDEAEVRYESANELNLYCIGGSANFEWFGLFGMSKSKVSNTLDKL